MFKPQNILSERIGKLRAENDALKLQFTINKKALELACTDLADSDCPHEYSFNVYAKPECENCTHLSEEHQDTERDVKCWKEYYLQLAKEEQDD